MKRLAAISVLLSATVLAQDLDWVRQWERTQRARPASIGSVGRIAPVSEPGTPLVVHGRVFKSDGVTPASGVVIFAYHTDRNGVYNVNGSRDWRLRGWAKSDEQGRFEFQTIRPASYPQGRTPAHIHLSIDSASVPRRWTEEIQFADDPFLSDAHRRAAAEVSVRGPVQHVDFSIRIQEKGRF